MFWDGESEDRGTGEREQSGGGGGESVGAGTGGYYSKNKSEKFGLIRMDASCLMDGTVYRAAH